MGRTDMSHDIRNATLENCIRDQEDSASWARLARIYRDHNQLGRAAQEQRLAASTYAEMYMRLERLIGVA